MNSKKSADMGVQTNVFPRQLRAKERNLLDFVLPADSPGYNEYRRRIASMVVLAEGRRGSGNVVLGMAGDRADLISPLPPVIAYGMVQTTFDTFSITVRECVEEQIDVEIVSSRGEEVPDHFEERWRWTYSTWRPGQPSPATGAPVRAVAINDAVMLVVAGEERRLWLYDAASRMNLLIPITNYYNELMLHLRIRDPKIALHANLLFDRLAAYTDADLRSAFIRYNAVKKRVEIPREHRPQQPAGIAAWFQRVLRKKSS